MITIIVAYSTNLVIGINGKIPWHLPDDLERFRRTTMGHHIVMGRKTWESIGRLLLGRNHIIISRQPNYKVPGALVVGTLKAAIDAATSDEVFVIGGSEVFALAVPIADRILATEIEQEFEGDSYFPKIDGLEWHETERERRKDSASGLYYSFVTFNRR